MLMGIQAPKVLQKLNPQNRLHPARLLRLVVVQAVLPQQQPDFRVLSLYRGQLYFLGRIAGNDGHRVSIGKKTILLLDGCFIAVKEGFASTEGGYQEHQG